MAKIKNTPEFLGNLRELVTVDIEFKNQEDSMRFHIPHFCLTEVIQERFLNGVNLCGM